MSRRRLLLLVGVAVLMTAAIVLGLRLLGRRNVPPDQRTVGEGGLDGPKVGPGVGLPPPLQPAPRPADGPETLVGQVVDLAGLGVAGVRVIAEPEAAGVLQPRDGESAADGRFSVPGFAAGSYRVRVEGERVLPAELRRVPLPGAAVTLLVQRTVVVSGVVLDEGGPAAGATVELAGGGLGAPREVLAAADGTFLFDAVPEGTFALAARLGARAGGLAEVEQLGAGPWATVTLLLGPAALLEGRIVDDRGDAVTGARLLLTPADEGSGSETGAPRRAQTGADGTFRVAGLLPGTWAVEIAAAGFLPPVLEALEATEGATLRLDVRLARGAVVTGRVLDRGGSPIANAVVELAGRDVTVTAAARARRAARVAGVGPSTGTGGAASAGAGRLLPIGELGVVLGPIPFAPPLGVAMSIPAAAAAAVAAADQSEPPLAEAGADEIAGFTTDADGRFRVDAVSAGRFVARAMHADYAPGESKSFDLTAAGTADLTITLAKGAAIEGRITAAGSGAPLPGAEIEARAGDHVLAVAYAADDGHYRLERLTGAVTLSATASGYGEAAVHVTVRAEDEGHTLAQSLALPSAGAAIAGEVADPTRRPLAGVDVSAALGDLARVGAVKARATSDALGRFTLTGLAEGASYVIEARHLDYPAVRVGAVKAGEDALRVTLTPGGGVAGDVRDAHTMGRVREFKLRAAGPGGAVRPARTFTDGEFELAPLEPGAWTLTVEARRYATKTFVVDVPAGRDARAITVRDVHLELVLGATLAGWVYDRHGEPLAAATVECGDVRATTDKRGHFRLTGVAPGDVPVRAAHATGGKGQKIVAIRSGDEILTIEIRTAD